MVILVGAAAWLVAQQVPDEPMDPVNMRPPSSPFCSPVVKALLPSAFTARVEAHVGVEGTNGVRELRGQVAYLDGMSLFEITSVKGDPIRGEPKKTKGKGGRTVICRPDKGLAYALNETIQGYAEMPLPGGTNQPTALVDTKSTEPVKETINGKHCVRKTVMVRAGSNTPQSATVWSAEELQGFPVRLLSEEGGRKLQLDFTDVGLTRPQAAWFEPPDGFTRFGSYAEMMTELMRRSGSAKGRRGVTITPGSEPERERGPHY